MIVVIVDMATNLRKVAIRTESEGTATSDPVVVMNGALKKMSRSRSSSSKPRRTWKRPSRRNKISKGSDFGSTRLVLIISKRRVVNFVNF